jgi:hypothetical protein
LVGDVLQTRVLNRVEPPRISEMPGV